MKIGTNIRPGRERWLLAACLAWVVSGCASTAQPPPEDATPPPPASAVSEGLSETEPGQAPDEWKVDEQGKRYRVIEIPKEEGTYSWVGEDEIKVGYGMRYHVVDESKDKFYVKWYDTSDGPVARPRRGPTPEEREAILASYSSDVEDVSRLEFRTVDSGLPSRGQWRNGFALADMNGDGHLDLVHGPPRKGMGGPSIFLGDGAGGWNRWSGLELPRLAYDYGDVAVADFDGDGRSDLALAIHLHGIVVLVQESPGRFVRWDEGLDYQIPGGGTADVGFTSRTVEAVDWDLDGHPDVLALGEGPRLKTVESMQMQEAEPTFQSGSRGLRIYLNGGDGTWSKVGEPSLPDYEPVFGDEMEVADLDGDGRPDAVLATSVKGRNDVLRMNRPGGAFEVVELPGHRDAAYTRAVAAADFDGDGRQDLAIGYLAYELETWRTGVDVHLRRPDGGWERTPLGFEEGRAAIYSLAGGDLDGDGAQDLVAITGNGAVWLFLGDGEGSFVRDTAGAELGIGERCRGYEVELADLDGDGRDEIVAAFAGEPSALFDATFCRSQGRLIVWDGISETGDPTPGS